MLGRLIQPALEIVKARVWQSVQGNHITRPNHFFLNVLSVAHDNRAAYYLLRRIAAQVHKGISRLRGLFGFFQVGIIRVCSIGFLDLRLHRTIQTALRHLRGKLAAADHYIAGSLSIAQAANNLSASSNGNRAALDEDLAGCPVIPADNQGLLFRIDHNRRIFRNGNLAGCRSIAIRFGYNAVCSRDRSAIQRHLAISHQSGAVRPLQCTAIDFCDCSSGRVDRSIVACAACALAHKCAAFNGQFISSVLYRGHIAISVVKHNPSRANTVPDNQVPHIGDHSEFSVHSVAVQIQDHNRGLFPFSFTVIKNAKRERIVGVIRKTNVLIQRECIAGLILADRKRHRSFRPLVKVFLGGVLCEVYSI